MATKFDLKGFINAWNTQNADRILEFYADNAEIVVPPDAEPYRGKEGVRQNIKDVTGGIHDLNADVAWSVQEGERVCALVHITGKHGGEMVFSDQMKLPATNKTVRFTAGMFLEVNGQGKIVRETDIVDNIGILQQIGAMQQMMQKR